MKKLVRILIFSFLICSIFLSSFGVLADPDIPRPVYLPLMVQGGGGNGGTFTVSGTVKDVDQFPVANVTITDKNDAVALTAVRGGYDIAPQNLNVTSNLTAVNFTAQVGCGSIVVNETLTVGMGIGTVDETLDPPCNIFASDNRVVVNSVLLSAGLAPGEYCVSVGDVGNVFPDQTVTYVVEVTHP